MRNKYSILYCLILVITSLSMNGAIASNNQAPSSSIFDELSYTETLDLTLEVDMSALTGDLRSTAKHKAKLSFIDKNGLQQTWNTKVNLRGKFRRMNCNEIPPIKINFKKGDLRDAGLLEFDDMKLVTQCIKNEDLASELVLKEYLAYKLYNQLTDESFRVQLLNITYVDTRTRTSKTQSAFLIEDTAEMRARINAKKCKDKIGISADKFNREQLRTVALFQYMIGNLDWNINTSQNLKMIGKDDKILAIPYDFDFSGLVDAPYAILNSNVGQTRTRQRIYLGIEKDQESLESEIILYKKEKKALIKCIKNFDRLSSSSRKDILNYIKSFYKRIDKIQFQKQAKISSAAVK